MEYTGNILRKHYVQAGLPLLITPVFVLVLSL